ncbi:MAG TPA: hypothetical protein VJ276_06805 [Thermoanaerobaculia bacterium]|nr:hypothetical protein [Thermoanaerobaculia bacterium]
MTEEEFAEVFQQALERAAGNAEQALGRAVPRLFEIELHGLAPRSRRMSKEDALHELYLGPDRFHRIIDVAVRRVGKDVTTVFTRVSGHEPGSWDETWNQPPGAGPFKQLIARDVEVI